MYIFHFKHTHTHKQCIQNYPYSTAVKKKKKKSLVEEGGGCGGRKLCREEAVVTIMSIDQSWVRDWTLLQLIPLHISSRQLPFGA